MIRALALVALLAGCADRAPGVVVFAAASAADVAQDAADRATTAETPVVVSAAASSTLARQIAAGAPADVFVSADGAWIDWLVDEGVDVRARTALARGRLVVVGPAGGRAAATLREALGGAGRIALGDPEHVPAGVYARDALRRAGLWASVQGRVVPQADARAALAAVETGAAEVAVVYASDALASRRVSTRFAIDPAGSRGIEYEAVLVRSEAGRPVLDALADGDLWAARGFEPAADR